MLADTFAELFVILHDVSIRVNKHAIVNSFNFFIILSSFQDVLSYYTPILYATKISNFYEKINPGIYPGFVVILYLH